MTAVGVWQKGPPADSFVGSLYIFRISSLHKAIFNVPIVLRNENFLFSFLVGGAGVLRCGSKDLYEILIPLGKLWFSEWNYFYVAYMRVQLWVYV